MITSFRLRFIIINIRLSLHCNVQMVKYMERLRNEKLNAYKERKAQQLCAAANTITTTNNTNNTIIEIINWEIWHLERMSG